MASARAAVQNLLAEADIQVGGGRPGDIIVRDERVYGRLLKDGSLGLGESYMDGWWDAPALDETITKILRADLQSRMRLSFPPILTTLKARFFNLQSKSRAFEVGEEHYDLGNDLYETMLDTRMVYTCGYWRHAKNLDEAQEAKLELVCKKIGLKKGQRVLDVGCGWGSFAKYAAEKHGASVVGITVSKEQAEFARENCKGLPVEIRVEDYRELD